MTAQALPAAVLAPVAPSPRHRVHVGGLGVDAVTGAEVLEVVESGWHRGRGGLIVTPNVDIWLRTRRDHDACEVVGEAALVVADGMPLVWASRLVGDPVPERVAGSELVESLCEVAAREERSVFVIGGGTGDTSERAARALAGRHPGVRVAGSLAPPFAFDEDPATYAGVVDTVAAAAPDLVLVGLGFPRQERLALSLAERLPRAWLIGCGGGVAMAAGDLVRAPQWAQHSGLEWVYRLAQEPQRLAHRYLVDDVPAALRLLTGSVLEGWGSRLARAGRGIASSSRQPRDRARASVRQGSRR